MARNQSNECLPMSLGLTEYIFFKKYRHIQKPDDNYVNEILLLKCRCPCHNAIVQMHELWSVGTTPKSLNEAKLLAMLCYDSD